MVAGSGAFVAGRFPFLAQPGQAAQNRFWPLWQLLHVGHGARSASGISRRNRSMGTRGKHRIGNCRRSGGRRSRHRALSRNVPPFQALASADRPCVLACAGAAHAVLVAGAGGVFPRHHRLRYGFSGLSDRFWQLFVPSSASAHAISGGILPAGRRFGKSFAGIRASHAHAGLAVSLLHSLCHGLAFLHWLPSGPMDCPFGLFCTLSAACHHGRQRNQGHSLCRLYADSGRGNLPSYP